MENGVLADEMELHQTVCIGIEDHAPGVFAVCDMTRHAFGNHVSHLVHRMS